MGPFDDLSLLRVFERLAESPSISAAARATRIPQPTLSRYLRTLEERAGATLVQRDTHAMRLTAAGHRFLASARAMRVLAEEGAQGLHTERVDLRGHLRVFATIDTG